MTRATVGASHPGFALVKGPAGSYHIPAVMSDTPEKPSSPNRSRPTLSGLAKDTLEDDLWELDDDFPTPAEALAAKETPLPADEVIDTPKDDAGTPAEPDVEEIPTAEPDSANAETEDTAKESASDTEPTDTARGESDASDEFSPRPSAATQVSMPKLSTLLPQARQERIGLIAMAVVVLGIGIWWLTSLFSDVTTTRLGDDQPDLPAKGRFAEIDSAESFWRSPVTSGENRDRVRNDVVIVPVITLELDDATNGIIRVNFRDSEGNFIGDTVNRPFANGVFTDSQSATVDFTATDGFKEISDYHSYRVGTGRWTAEVLEGPSEAAPGSEFKPLFTLPISPERR